MLCFSVLTDYLGRSRLQNAMSACFIVFRWEQLNKRVVVTVDMGTVSGCRFNWGGILISWCSGCCDGWLNLVGHASFLLSRRRVVTAYSASVATNEMCGVRGGG